MKLQMRGGLVAIAIVGSAIVAAGCGGSDSGSKAAAKDAAALDFVPKDAIGYATVDTDFSGDGWKQLSELATAFDADFKPVSEQISTAAADGEDKVDFEKDVDPWLGESGGVAILGIGGDSKEAANEDVADDAMESGSDDISDNAEVFVWVEVDDRAALEEFNKDQDLKEDGEVGDFTVWSDDDSVLGVSDDLAIMVDSKDQLKDVVEYDGDSIKDADGVSDAIDAVEGDSLATLVISGAGLKKVIKEAPQAESLGGAAQLDDFQAFALALVAEDDGIRLDGRIASKGEPSYENSTHDLFEKLPASTVFAAGGNDLGGTIVDTTKSLGEDNPEVQQGVAAVTAALGVSTDDIEGAMDGEFVLGMSAEDAGLGALAGSVAGAAMGGGASSVDPAQLVKAATIVLAFEETGETGATLEKLVGGGAGLTGATAAPKAGTKGDFATKELAIQGMPVTLATSDEVAAVSVGADVFTTWSSETLGESDAFTAAWDAAGVPEETAGLVWFNAGRVATLAGVEGAEGTSLGGFVSWVEMDGSNADFVAFMHVDQG